MTSLVKSVATCVDPTILLQVMLIVVVSCLHGLYSFLQYFDNCSIFDVEREVANRAIKLLPISVCYLFCFWNWINFRTMLR